MGSGTGLWALPAHVTDFVNVRLFIFLHFLFFPSLLFASLPHFTLLSFVTVYPFHPSPSLPFVSFLFPSLPTSFCFIPPPVPHRFLFHFSSPLLSFPSFPPSFHFTLSLLRFTSLLPIPPFHFLLFLSVLHLPFTLTIHGHGRREAEEEGGKV